MRSRLIKRGLLAAVSALVVVTGVGGVAHLKTRHEAAAGEARSGAGGGARTLAAAPAFPLKLSKADGTTGGRYLVDSAGNPFRVNMEAAWLMSYAATDGQISSYIADRKSKKFTAFAMMGMAHPGGYSGFFGIPGDVLYKDAPNNRESGEGPFTTPGDFSTLNPKYWDHVESIVKQAHQAGMAVVLAYAYLGFDGGNQGWAEEIRNTPESVMFAFGEELGRRFGDEGNVIWYPAGDFNPSGSDPAAAGVRASMEGIEKTDSDALFGAELNGPDDLSSDNGTFGDLMDLETFYGYGPGSDLAVYETARKAFATGRPSLVGEPPYENIPIGSSGSREDIRLAEYYSVLGGGTAGQGFGTSGVWSFNRQSDIDASGVCGNEKDEKCFTLEQAMDSPASKDMEIQFTLFDSLPWHLLVPSDATAGGFKAPELITDPGNGTDHVASAITASGSHLLAYVPFDHQGPFEVNVSALAGQATAEWLDPTTGKRVPDPTNPTVSNSGTVTFSTDKLGADKDGRNADGQTDWVLVLTAG